MKFIVVTAVALLILVNSADINIQEIGVDFNFLSREWLQGEAVKAVVEARGSRFQWRCMFWF